MQLIQHWERLRTGVIQVKTPPFIPISFTLIRVVIANSHLAGYCFAPTAHSCTLRIVDSFARFWERFSREQASESSQNTSGVSGTSLYATPGGSGW